MSDRRAKAKRVSPAAPALLVPRFVLSFNEMARKCGLTVDIGSRDPAPYDHWDNGHRRLVVIWSGKVKQLRATGIFNKSYRFPTGAQGMKFSFSQERRGRVFSEGRCWRVEVNCEEIPIRLEQHGDIEVIHYAEETAHGGAAAAVSDALRRQGRRIGRVVARSTPRAALLRCSSAESAPDPAARCRDR